MKPTPSIPISLRRLAAAFVCAFVVLTAGSVRAQGTLGFTTLYAFTDAADGGLPYGGVLEMSDGTIYGTTYFGGNNNAGTIYKIAPDGTFTTLHAFSALDNAEFNADGARPYAALVQGIDGALYGTTSQGGANGLGVVYRLTRAGEFSVVATFDQTYTGGHSHAPLIMNLGDGNLYGTTYDGAFGGGTVFKIGFTNLLTIEGLTVLTTFGDNSAGNASGLNPAGPLCRAADGNLYGTTYDGGSNNHGTVFEITPDGVFTVIHTFSATTDNKNSDGANPYGGVVEGFDRLLYGTTTAGGANAEGVAFAIRRGVGFQTLASFDAATNGSHPYGTLLQASDGNFYGTTTAGGNGNGNVFQLKPTGVLTSVGVFDFSTSGATPYAGLFQGTDGNFYGTTTGGGGNGYGTVFALAPVPTVTLEAITPIVTNGGPAVGFFTLALSAPQDHDVFVNYTVKGSAINGTDYVFLKGRAKIKAGKTGKSIRVRPQGDLEGAAKKVVTLVLADGGGYLVGTTGKVKIKILAPH